MLRVHTVTFDDQNSETIQQAPADWHLQSRTWFVNRSETVGRGRHWADPRQPFWERTQTSKIQGAFWTSALIFPD